MPSCSYALKISEDFKRRKFLVSFYHRSQKFMNYTGFSLKWTTCKCSQSYPHLKEIAVKKGVCC